MNFSHSKSQKRNLATFLLLVFLSTLVFNFLLLPTKIARATVPVQDMSVVSAIGAAAAKDSVFQSSELGKWAESIGLTKEQITTLKDSLQVGKDSLKALGEIGSYINAIFENETLKQLANTIAFLLLKELLAQVTDQINKWINNGKTPQFVGDWKLFLQNAADQAGGKFVDTYLGAGFLCSHFDTQIKIALASSVPFTEAAKCTVSDMVGNVGDFLGKFENGGWQAWASISEPQNNIYGAYLMALDQKNIEMSTAAEAAKNEAIAGNGFLGTRDSNGQITVPGHILSDQINRQIDSSRQMLQDQIVALVPHLGPLGDMLLPYLQSIADTLLNKLIKTGLGAAGVQTPP